MNFKGLKKPELLELARELGLQIAETKRKQEIIDAIERTGAEDEELSECSEDIKQRKEEQRLREEKEEKERIDRLEMKRLEVELANAQSTNRASPVAQERER
ncbi:hypothetical protein HPB51_009386 [Rhipicephalus microplus]|uniref:Rho termination factor-like N-terminal domain-containing protein n=1 Tax=Rhipicephalus microplus TaxID=6941 RepID=A0A9J6F077_RHIMP|nr:hypothetical protein HPB51_009386 [Rhipicephalus microplus]